MADFDYKLESIAPSANNLEFSWRNEQNILPTKEVAERIQAINLPQFTLSDQSALHQKPSGTFGFSSLSSIFSGVKITDLPERKPLPVATPAQIQENDPYHTRLGVAEITVGSIYAGAGLLGMAYTGGCTGGKVIVACGLAIIALGGTVLHTNKEWGIFSR